MRRDGRDVARGKEWQSGKVATWRSGAHRSREVEWSRRHSLCHSATLPLCHFLSRLLADRDDGGAGDHGVAAVGIAGCAGYVVQELSDDEPVIIDARGDADRE